MPELTLRVCEIPIRVTAEDRRFIASARKRYAPFLTTAKPALSIDLELVTKRMRPFRDEPRVVWDGRAGRVDRHDLELELAPGLGRGPSIRRRMTSCSS